MGCLAGTCKCSVAQKLSQEKPIVLIGDGCSDFCLTDKADYVFAKGNLIAYCRDKGIIHSTFKNFRDIIQGLHQLEISDMRFGRL